ncbi:hypothetical protein FHG87_009418 [Trinorchestia longiramus]|nr:hypothetical protein FHG87_009418 [Trinorchestia longiramus]
MGGRATAQLYTPLTVTEEFSIKLTHFLVLLPLLPKNRREVSSLIERLSKNLLELLPGIQAGAGAGVQAGAGSGVQTGAGSRVQAGAGSGVQAGAGSGVQTGAGSGVQAGAGSGVQAGAGSGARSSC